MKTQSTFLVAGFAALAFAAHAAEGDFFQKLAQGGKAEVAAGQLAENKGTSAEVSEYGAMMVDQHGATNQKLADLAKAKGIELPATPSKAQLDSFKALQAKKGARFDQEYLAEQIKAHEETVQLLKSEIASGQDPDAKAFAREILPTVESHLRKAYHLAGKDEMAEAVPN